jgi:predicted transcriptional regulator
MRITLTVSDEMGAEVQAIAAREKHTTSRMAAILLEQAIKERERSRKKRANG